MTTSAMKPMPAGALMLARSAFNHYCLDLADLLPAQVTVSDLMKPAFWLAHVKGLHEGDMVRVIAADRSYDFVLTVEAKSPGGILMTEPTRTVGAEWDDLTRRAEAVGRSEEVAAQAKLDAELGGGHR